MNQLSLEELRAKKKSIQTRMRSAEDFNEISAMSMEILQVDQAIANYVPTNYVLTESKLLSDDLLSAALVSDPDEIAEEEVVEAAGFAVPKEEPVTQDASANPVQMPPGMRRQVGEIAADFMDDYALTLHQQMMRYVEKLRDLALKMEAGEDPNDGVTSFEEKMRDEIGRRGVEAVRPMFDKWREHVFKQITKTVNEMFAVPKAPIDLTDSQIGQMLGVDDKRVEERVEVADEAESEGMEKEEAEKKALKETPAVASAEPAEEILTLATGPISLTIPGQAQPVKDPLTASVHDREPSKVATDFVTTGRGTHRLD